MKEANDSVLAEAVHLHGGENPLTRNRHLIRWVEKMAALTAPKSIHWVNGSQGEFDHLCTQLEGAGTLIRLNPALRPGCFYSRSDPRDVARVEERTYIC